MELEQARWMAADGWHPREPGSLDADLVLVFGSRALLEDHAGVRTVREAYPRAVFLGCSTAGEISGTRVLDNSLVVTAVKFEHTRVRRCAAVLGDGGSSFAAGKALAESLKGPGLAHVFVLSDGTNVNGSQLVKGITTALPPTVSVTGGLSGDGNAFGRTVVLADEGAVDNTITALGMYGDRLRIGCGSLGGWDAFGPERLITRSEDNVLYELDGKSALDLYRMYLGDHAEGLPGTGLLFPLAVRAPDSDVNLVRTILAVDEASKSMTFAGDVPRGWTARLMRANFDRLVDGAQGAARDAMVGFDERPELAVLVSCVGRKMVLKGRVEEEVEAVRDVFGDATAITGFYSYGEISPSEPSHFCELHNQTMTITTLSEQ